MSDHKDDNEVMLNELKAKIKTLDVPERKKAVALYGIFKQIVEEVNKEQTLNDDEYNKYNNITSGITTQMDEIIEGKRPINEEEINFWKQEEPEFTVDENLNVSEKIKEFWKGFIVNGDIYHGDCDMPILSHLQHIEAKTVEDENDNEKKQITLTFEFSENEFFENESLWVKLYTANEDPEKSEACTIKWKNNPTVEKTQKKQKNKRTGHTRVINKEVQKRSFFEIFNKFEAEEEEENVNKNNEEEESSMNLYLLEETVNEILDMMPYALEYYLDVRPEDDDEGKTIEEDDDDDEDDDQDDEKKDKDDESDESEGRHKFKSRKSSEHQGNKNQDKKGKNNKDNPKQECKQQ